MFNSEFDNQEPNDYESFEQEDLISSIDDFVKTPKGGISWNTFSETEMSEYTVIDDEDYEWIGVRPKFKENNREGIYSTDKKTEPLNFKTVPEKELIEKKKRIRNRAENQRKKEQLIFGIFIFCGLISIIGILLWLN